MSCSVFAENYVIKANIESKGGTTTTIIKFSSKYFNALPGDTISYNIKSNAQNTDAINIIGISDYNTKEETTYIDSDNTPNNWKTIVSPIADKKILFKGFALKVNGIMDSDTTLKIDIDNIKIIRNGKTIMYVYTDKKTINPSTIYYNSSVRMAYLDSVKEDEPLRDTLSWLNSMLPSNTYIGIHAENWNKEKKKWTTNVEVLQPFKSMVYKPWNVAFWRKDAPQNFYGELFTFDINTLRLHSETFPPKTPVDPENQTPWMDVISRARLFVADSDGNNTLDFSKGRIMATMNGSASSEFIGYMDTFMTSSFEELNSPTPRKYQENVYDHVYITREAPYSNVYDGEIEGYEAEKEFKNFDEAWIINQCMNNNAARERFIFARKGNTYYGAVRWDNSFLVNGKWEVSDRAVGLKRITQTADFKFDGFFNRVANEDRIAPTDIDFLGSIRTSFNKITDWVYNPLFTVQNTGKNAWKKGNIALYGRLRDENFEVVPNTSQKIADINTDVNRFEEYTFSISQPTNWIPGTYYMEFDVSDKESAFNNPNRHSFIKRIKIIAP